MMRADGGYSALDEQRLGRRLCVRRLRLKTLMKTLASERDTSELLQRLRKMRRDSERRWGKMNPHQMVCHLTDSCFVALGEKPVKEVSSLPQRTIVKCIALYAPMRWPAGLATTPEIDQHVGGTCPTDFAADLTALEKQMERLAARRRYNKWPRHPIFGRMSERAWLRWAYLHTDHHLRQFGE
jgi:hypothetical protein